MKLSRRHLLAGTGAAALAGCASSENVGAAPASADALADLDAVGVAARIRIGEITASEATAAAIARAERINPTLNFIATPGFDYGRTRAASALSGPFAGVPTLIKDLNDLAGLKTMYGCRAYRDNVSTTTDGYVQAILAAGAVPIGKSTTPEFGLTCTTEPLVTGVTRNPWNIDHIAGGSSGGAAAAVASGVVPIAHASDGGGSVRIPASICGLVGLKTSRGRMSGENDNSPVSIGINCCVSRTVRDTAAWLAATQKTGADKVYDPVAVIAGPNERRLRIGLAITSYDGVNPDPDVRSAIEDVARACEGLGHHVTPYALPINGQEFEDAFILYWASGALQTREELRASRAGTPLEDLLEPLTLQLADHAQRAGAEAIGRAITVLRATDQQYAGMFANLDLVLTPTLAKAPLRVGEIAPTLPFDVGFRRVLEYVKYTPYSNASGGCAISLPLSQNAAGLPIGSHFMAPKGEEARLLHLAYELEMARPWARRKPAVWAG